MDRVWLQQYPAGVPTDIDPDQYSSLREDVRGGLRRLRQPHRLPEFRRDLELRTARRLEPGVRRVAAEEIGAGARRPGRADDAERPAVSHRTVRNPARRHGGRERQSAVHRPRARAPAQGFRRQGHRHPREFRPCPAAGAAEDGPQARSGDAGRRSSRLAARDGREFRGALRTQADPRLEHAGRIDVQERLVVGARPEARRPWSSARRTSRSCNTPAGRRASPRPPFSPTGTWWRTCSRRAPGSGRRSTLPPRAWSSPRCRSITSSR